MESNFGYQIGQRVKCIDGGWASNHSNFKNDREMKKNEEGIITNIDGNWTEILLTDGKYVTRNESITKRFIKILENKTPNYEIY